MAMIRMIGCFDSRLPSSATQLCAVVDSADVAWPADQLDRAIGSTGFMKYIPKHLVGPLVAAPSVVMGLRCWMTG